LALFGKKTTEEPGKGPEPAKGTNGKTADAAVAYAPDKAIKFFDHARTVDEATNYEYAIGSWLTGLRWDPFSLSATEGFFHSVSKFLSDPASKKGIDKKIVSSVSGKSDIDRYLLAILEWALKPSDSVLAVRALETAAKLQIIEPAFWIGERVFACVTKEKKVRKDLLMKVSDSFSKIGAFDRSVAAAEVALKLNPADGELSAYIRSLAAQATMARGGYEKSGQKGAFRQNIRDADKQRMLDESERVSKTDQTVDRLLASTAEEYVKRPGDLPTIERYAKLLLERGRPEDEERAHTLYMEAFSQANQFRFRELAGELKVRQSRRKVVELKKMLDASPGNEMVTRMFDQASDEHLRLELEEYKLRVAAYPTDLTRKFELGKRYFAVGQYNEAIDLFQESQGDPKNRGATLNYLGQAFLKIHWNDEAVETFRKALEVRELTPEAQLEVRYWLMVSLQEKGTEARDLGAAEEADKIASSIAVQQISYRDIRARRDSIKKLLGELRKAG